MTEETAKRLAEAMEKLAAAMDRLSRRPRRVWAPSESDARDVDTHDEEMSDLIRATLKFPFKFYTAKGE